MLRRLSLLLGLLAVLPACSPSFSPLYRDYDVEPLPETAEGDVYARIRAALAQAGWAEAEPAAPGVITTAPREVSDWGLSRVEVSLDVTPLGGRYVRVLFHPVRRYITGGRSKISSLDGGLRRALLPELNAAFEAQGLVPLGTPRDRDEEVVEGT